MSLEIAVQPPSKARPGVPLYPPIAARLSSETSIHHKLSTIWAAATLIHYSGEVLWDQTDAFGGTMADSAHPLPEGMRNDRAYFYFPDLVIHEPGRYRIRISLMVMEESDDQNSNGTVVVREYVDSRSITVEDRHPNGSLPSSRERAFLRVLRDDGKYIPSAPA